ncbi:MAG: CPBP family intramembrane metalloprotease [Phycisphaerae bacterium]|nr:CPBP family intramembrane metalloprotease [Phycisphaerae bacterium]
MNIDIKQLVIGLGLTAVLAVGAGLFIGWLTDTRWGTRALLHSRPRRNNMPPVVPLALFFIWLAGAGLGAALVKRLFPNITDRQFAIAVNIIYVIWGVVTVGTTTFFVKRHFARGLRGFGIRFKTAGRDFAWAAVNLVSVWPLIFAAMYITLFIGKLIYGADFQMTQHEELKLLTEYSSPPMIAAIIIVAVVAAPIVEELLFRGMFQTIIRSYTGSAWIGIFFTAALFSMIHITNPTHLPAIFVLSLCLGYAYEKSGSLLRSIFIHAMFNATAVIGTLLGA